MFRRMWMPVAGAMALVASLAAAPSASADWVFVARDHRPVVEIRHYPVHEHHHHRDFHVFYRACCNDPWVSYGCFDCRERADRVACRLRESGYEVFVR